MQGLKTFVRTSSWLAGIVFLFTGTLHAQVFEAGVFGGISYYLGDLNLGKHFQNVKPAYGLMIRYNIDDRWAVKLSGTRGQIEGASDKSGFLPESNLSFTSNITDISAIAEFNFLRYFTGSKRNAVAPYIFGGISMFFFNPRSGDVDLCGVGTEGQNVGYEGRKPYATIGFGVPFGVGVKISLGKRLAMTAFWEMHKTFTDYLDDVSKTYYLDGKSINPDDPEALLSDPTMNHTPGMQRGNSRTQDWYSFTGVTLTYQFSLFGSKRCRDLEH